MSDLVPNEGNFFTPQTPDDDKVAASRERAQTLEALPILEEVIEWFEQQADECDRISTLDTEAKQSLEVQIASRQLTASLLRGKKGELAALVDAYQK